MAKIASYQLDNDVQLTDMVIGSDVADSSGSKNLMTKNYSVESILNVVGSATYVPYTGATDNVDLGVFGLLTTNISILGVLTDGSDSVGVDGQVLSVDSFGKTKWIGLTAAIGVVPYTGATNNVNLGGFGLAVGDMEIRGFLKDASGDIGTAGQVLTSTGALTNWTSSLLSLSAVKSDDITITENLYDSLSVAATEGALLTGDATGKPIWFVGQQVLYSESVLTQNVPLDNTGLITSFGPSIAATPYIAFSGTTLGFIKAGTYVIEASVNAKGTLGATTAMYAISTINGQAGSGTETLTCGPSAVNLNSDNSVSFVSIEVVHAAAGDIWRKTFGTNDAVNQCTLISQTMIGIWSDNYAIPSASLRVYKIS